MKGIQSNKTRKYLLKTSVPRSSSDLQKLLTTCSFQGSAGYLTWNNTSIKLVFHQFTWWNRSKLYRKKRVPSSWLILLPCSLLTMHWMIFAVVLCQALGQCKWANRVDEQRKSKQWKSVAFMQLFLIHFPYYLDDWESLLCRNPKIKVSHGRGVPYLPTHVVLLYERCSTLLPPTLKNHFSFNFNPLRPVSNVTLLPC